MPQIRGQRNTGVNTKYLPQIETLPQIQRKKRLKNKENWLKYKVAASKTKNTGSNTLALPQHKVAASNTKKQLLQTQRIATLKTK